MGTFNICVANKIGPVDDNGGQTRTHTRRTHHGSAGVELRMWNEPKKKLQAGEVELTYQQLDNWKKHCAASVNACALLMQNPPSDIMQCKRLKQVTD